ncbi:MAG: hypothetical protein QOG62_985 [Thermoleophilaceae bacterium]|jgi:hypothetical protein|nr:hypothetical protein [Thermoleophilaceae bacterium]
MTDDRLGDLGSERKSAAERLAEMDEAPEEGSGKGSDKQDPKQIANRYTWVVGVAAIIAIIIALATSAPPGTGYLGLEPGSTMPEFAAPTALSGSKADANVRQPSGGAANEGSQPACQVHGPTVVNICDLQDKPIVLTFVTKGCQFQLDTAQAVSADYPGVNFVGIIADVNHPEVPGQLVRAGGWTFPIAADNDAAVFNLYRAGSCPTTVFAEPGGKVQGTALNRIDAGPLSARIDDLVKPGAGKGR